jgi:glycosyltransferase involved in cell wall biosynthesis/ubiquinone/menaquinone biosynthesis C-methylase UbiE/thioredoxin-like negative regulator of GroEL
MKLKILTFNWHEPYLCLLSQIGHEFLVVEPELVSGDCRKWDQNMRPVPNNVRLISSTIAKDLLELSEFDLIIAHNINDLIEVKDYSVPKIMVFHNCLSTEIGLSKNKVSRTEYLDKVNFLLEGVHKVFISDKKRLDWGLSGDVILPGLDVSEYGGYQGNIETVLQVGNLLQERDLMMGYSISQKIIGEHPLTVLGMNPNILGSRLSQGFQDLQENFKKSRVFINTTVEEYEDGYNLSMLEAMATGMPVISSWNKTSPIENGVNGYISEDIEYLNERIEYLLRNKEEARMLGENARKTVQERFPLKQFVYNWRKAVEKSVLEFLQRTGINLDKESLPFEKKVRKNILMDFVSYPATTAYFLERAFRQKHNVITCGSQINEQIKDLWNLKNLNWEITPQNIFRDNATPLKQVVTQLPDGWSPDFYLWVETGLSDIPADLCEHEFPKACYLIDTHIHFERHLEIAQNFDFVFLAQKDYVQSMLDAGVKNVIWLPLACDPEIHGKVEVDKEFDVGFIGTISKNPDRRNILLKKLEKQFDLNCQRKFMNEMAEHYSKSRIIFNNAINNDLNMRVFEALCSGSLLVTDSAPGSGLEDFFKDKEHLVIYDDKNLETVVSHYLNNNAEMDKIAKEGRKEVLAKHTYLHRTERMIRILNEKLSRQNEEELASMSDKPNSYYENVRTDLIPLVSKDASCILEIGCGAGNTGNELKKRYGAFVAGVELNTSAANLAKDVLDDVINGNIEDIDLPYGDSSFDCILFADVLEHLVDPLSALKKVRRLLKKGGSVVTSIPNVQFHGVINQLIEGNWTYEKEGILDETHLRFFTYKEIQKLFSKAGYSIEVVEEVIDPQYEKFSLNDATALNFGRTQIKDLSKEEIKKFFVFQYLIKAKMTNIDQIEGSDMSDNDENLFKIDNLLLEASKVSDTGEHEIALKLYEEIIKIAPDNVPALVGMGNAYMKLQLPDKAENYFNIACLKEPNSSKAWQGLGLLDLHRNDIKNADINLNKSLESDPSNDKALCGLGMLRIKRRDFDGAVDYFCRALNVNSENMTAFKLLLETSYELEKFDEIENRLNHYVELHPGNINMLFALAGVQYKLGKLEDSIKNLECILVLDPEHESALELLDNVKSDLVVSK